MTINTTIKSMLLATSVLGGLVAYDAIIAPQVHAESFSNNDLGELPDKYSFGVNFTSRTRVVPEGAYSKNWTTNEYTEIGQVGNYLPNGVQYGPGGGEKPYTLTSNGYNTDAGQKNYGSNHAVMRYTNVGVVPKTGKPVDLKIAVVGARDSNDFKFDYRKISFNRNSLGFAETGYKYVSLQYQLVYHGTNTQVSTNDIPGFNINLGDIDRYQYVYMNTNDIKKVDYAVTSKNSIIKREASWNSGYSTGTRYMTYKAAPTGKYGAKDSSLSLHVNGTSLNVAIGKDYNALLNKSKITLNGKTNTYKYWNNYYGNKMMRYRMRKESAAAEYINLHADTNGAPVKPDGPALVKKIKNTSNNTWGSSYTDNDTNPYNNTLSYEALTSTLPKVPSNYGNGQYVISDKLDSGLIYDGAPKVTRYNPDGSVSNATGDFNYKLSADKRSFTLSAKDGNYTKKHAGAYFKYEYKAKMNSATATAVNVANNKAAINNTVSQTWFGKSSSGKATFYFKPTKSTVQKTVSIAGGAQNQTATQKLDASKVNNMTYTLHSQLGNLSSSNKTIPTYGITDTIPRIFNKVATKDVTILNNGKNVTGDFNVSLSGNAYAAQTLKVTPKSGTKYLGSNIDVKVNVSKAALGSTTSNAAVQKALDSYLTSTNNSQLNSAHTTDVVVPNSYQLAISGDKTLTSNQANVSYNKIREYVNPYMKGSSHAPRKSTNDNDVYTGKWVDGYRGQKVPANTVVFNTMPGWQSVTGKNGYAQEILLDTPGKTYRVDYIKSPYKLQADKIQLDTANGNHAFKINYSMTRSNIWNGYKFSTDPDLANARINVQLKDDKGHVVYSASKALNGTDVKATESTSGTTAKYAGSFAGKLNTSKATFGSQAEPGASTTAKIKNLHVSTSLSYGTPSVKGDARYGGRKVGSDTANSNITWENGSIAAITNGTQEIAWTPTNQKLSYNDLIKSQPNKVSGQYKLSGIQSTVTNLTNGKTANKLESLNVKDDALDFEISAGYGFSNTPTLTYSGYNLSNYTDKSTVNGLVMPDDIGSQLVGNSTTKKSSTKGQTTLANVYDVKNTNGKTTNDGDLAVSSKNWTRQFSFKPAYLTASGKAEYTKSSGSSNGGNKLYTSTDTNLDSTSKYHKMTTTLSTGLGANNFAVSYDKHVRVGSPVVLTAADKDHNDDAELAFQQVFDNFKPSGFTAKQNNWLKK